MKNNFTLLLQKSTLFLAIFWMSFAYSQNQNLEFATVSGDGNPTGNGPVTSTTINFIRNTNNPSGNTFTTHSPALSATFSLVNQQYSYSGISTNVPANFGYTTGNTDTATPPVSSPIFGFMNAAGAPAVANFTSSGATTGNGLDPTANRGVQMNLINAPLQTAGLSTNGRHRMVDLKIDFSRPVNNPILHISGMGATYGIPSLGFSTEFDFVSSNVPVSFSKLSGTTAFNITSTQIRNSATTIGSSGANSGSGSVLISGTGITTITLRIYMRGDGGNPDWINTAVPTNPAGESTVLSFSTLESDLEIAKTVNSPTVVAGNNVIFTLTAKNNGPSIDTNVIVNDILPTGYVFISAVPSAGAGSYNSGTGVWSVGSLNNGESKTLTLTAQAQPTGNYTNTAAISGTNIDSNQPNNTASVTVIISSPCTDGATPGTPTANDPDGDGINNICDLDDDNDGISDLDEGCVDFVFPEDFFIPLYHANIVNSDKNRIFVTGQRAHPNGSNNINVFTEIISGGAINGTGGGPSAWNTFSGVTKKLVGADGSDPQYVLLTSTNMYVWGTRNELVPTSLTSSTAFQNLAFPAGVTAADVKDITSGPGILALITNSGKVYTLGSSEYVNNGSIYGDNSTNRDSSWHTVQYNPGSGVTDLLGVIDLDITNYGAFAILNNGDWYTWGNRSYLGNNTVMADNKIAVKMTKPAAFGAAQNPKQIEMTGGHTATDGASYFASHPTDGKIYVLGGNNSGQIGIGSTTQTRTWTTVKSNAAGTTELENVIFIGCNSYSTDYPSGSAIVAPVGSGQNKIYMWGANNSQTLSSGLSTTQTFANTPAYDNTASGNYVNINAPSTIGDEDRNPVRVGTGGHLSIYYDSYQKKYGFVGHNTDGAFGATVTDPGKFSMTPNPVDFLPNVPDTDNDGIPDCLDVDSDGDGCPDAMEGSERVLNNQVYPLDHPTVFLRGQIRVVYDGVTTNTPQNIISTSPSALGVPQLVNNAGNNYHVLTNPSNLAGVADNTGTAPVAGVGQGFGSAYDATVNSCICYNDANTTGTALPTKHGITLLQRAGADNGNWPMNRSSAHTVLESNTKGFVITRMNPTEIAALTGQEGMMVYDTTAKCLKIYADGTWKCFSKPSCP